MMKSIALLLCILNAAISPVSAEQTRAAAQVVACSAQEIALSSDAKNGNFDGMSQSGTLLVFRNNSTSACSLEAFARIVMEDKSGKALNVSVERKTAFTGPTVYGRPVPMGHGPVVFPLVVPPRARATTQLHWVTGSVFDHSVCLDAARVSVDIGGIPVQTDVQAHICGPDATHVSVSATRLLLDSAHGS